MRADLSVEQAWVSYLIPGDRPESVAVHTGLDAVRDGLAGRRVLRLVLPYAPVQAGFPAADDVDAMEDVVQILAPVRHKLRLQQMGWRIGAGRRVLCWLVEAGQTQAAAEDLARELTGAAAQLWEGATCTLMVDSADRVYRDFLAPDAAARPFLHDGAVLLGLPDKGDPRRGPRPSGPPDLAGQEAPGGGAASMSRLWQFFRRITWSS